MALGARSSHHTFKAHFFSRLQEVLGEKLLERLAKVVQPRHNLAAGTCFIFLRKLDDFDGDGNWLKGMSIVLLLCFFSVLER